MLGIKKSNTAYNIGEWNNKAMKVQRILDAAFFFVEINIFFGRLAGERIECCKNDRISADMLYWFKGSIGNIYQSFAGMEVYPTLEEKAAHLLYFVTKNHSFFDGNKRIAAAMFLYFLDKNGALFANGQKTIDDHTLVVLTIMIAESRPDEMEMMITVVMNCMKK